LNTSQQNKTLWIGELEEWMDENYLLGIFSKYASIKSIKIKRDRNTHQHQGYGFIEFTKPQDAEKLLKENIKIPEYKNEYFKLNWATLSEGKKQLLNLNNNTIQIQNYTIYVCDLDKQCSEDLLKSTFKQFYKSVSSSKVIVDPITKESKGYGFVMFNDFNESQNALSQMNGYEILSKKIKTNKAVWKKLNNIMTNVNKENKNTSNYSSKIHKNPHNQKINYTTQNLQNLQMNSQEYYYDLINQLNYLNIQENNINNQNLMQSNFQYHYLNPLDYSYYYNPSIIPVKYYPDVINENLSKETQDNSNPNNNNNNIEIKENVKPKEK